MKLTRRLAMVLTASAGLTPFAAFVRQALSVQQKRKRRALYGKWRVRCPLGHVDVVTDGTRQHECEHTVHGKKCNRQCFVNNKVTVMCPKGHANVIDLADVDVLTSYKCRTKVKEGDTEIECAKECQGW
jgi:hypothetical protein